MRLAVSDIAWTAEHDEAMYDVMKKMGFDGLEIAPTRIFEQSPYDRLKETADWADSVRSSHGLTVCSMQSIWYGRSENIFVSASERNALKEYTFKAIDFAKAAGCGNLVFGCPKNRNIPEGSDVSVAVEFFRDIGAYAASAGTVVSLEANPPIYNTNYINDTAAAFDLAEEIASPGIMVNLDVGTMTENGEDVSIIRGREDMIGHVHISEPYLKPVEHRDIHRQLAEVLKEAGYGRYVSVEMGRRDDISDVIEVMEYVAAIFDI